MKGFCSTWYSYYALWYWTVFIVGSVVMYSLVGGIFSLVFIYPTDTLFISLLSAFVSAWIFGAWLPFSFILIVTERKEWQATAIYLSGCAFCIVLGTASLVLVCLYPVKEKDFYEHLHQILSTYIMAHKQTSTLFPEWIHIFQSQFSCCGLRGSSDYMSMGTKEIPYTCRVGSIYVSKSIPRSSPASAPDADADADADFPLNQTPSFLHFSPIIGNASGAGREGAGERSGLYQRGCLGPLMELRDTYMLLLWIVDAMLLAGSLLSIIFHSCGFSWLLEQPMIILTNRVYIRTSQDLLKAYPEILSDEAVSISSSDEDDDDTL